MANNTFIDWNIEELTGYKPQTTFYMDFSIADKYGLDAIKETYERAFKSWKNNYIYITELVLVLNWKSWQHSETKEDYTRLYIDLYEQARDYALDNLKDNELKYFLTTTD